LTASYIETLTRDGLWIYDKKTQDIIDMKNVNPYSFTSNPSDATDRFLVLFSNPVKSGLNDIRFKLYLYYNDKKVIVKQLTENNLGNKITLFDLQGKQLRSCVINNFPEMKIDVSDLERGVYIIQVSGNLSASAKFIVN